MGSQWDTPPRVFISYTHDSEQHRRRVLELSERLRSNFVNAWIDQYVEDKGIEWPEWTEQQIASADAVLVVCTAHYRDAFEGKVAPGLSKGVKWEARFIRRHIYRSDSANARFYPVLLEGASPVNIPDALQGSTYYSPDEHAGYIKLCRRIFGRPRIIERQIGSRLELPAEGVELPPLTVTGPNSVSVRIVLADDHTFIRAGLRIVLEQEPDFKVVGEATDGREAVDLVLKHHPEIAVIDIGMPVLNGIEATRQIVSAEPSTHVVILSMHSDEPYVLRALKAGAKAYLLKDSAESDLTRAIRAVAEGKSFFSPAVCTVLLEDYRRRSQGTSGDSYELLSLRERKILQLLVEGNSSKEVARMLKLNVVTVETRRARLMQKLELRGMPELVLYAVRRGILS